MSWNIETGRWHCKRCNAGGGPLQAVALLAGLSIANDFPRVLEIAAEIAGVVADADPVAAQRQRDDAKRRAEERRAAAAADERARRARAREIATAEWARLLRRHDRGERWLTGRSIDPASPIARDLVRFYPCGDPAVAIYSSAGAITNVQRRRIEPGDGPKAIGLRDCPIVGTMVGNVEQIVGGCDVVIAEGVTDALAASLAWPHAVILGAHSAGTYATIARVAAPRVRLAGGRLLLCIDADDAGEAAGIAAVRHAFASGLALDRTLVLVDTGDHHDLADAWAAGWRPPI